GELLVASYRSRNRPEISGVVTSARSTFWLLGCDWCLGFSFRINRRFLRSVDRLNGYIAGSEIISRPGDSFRVIIKNDRLFETLNLSISDRHVFLMINQNADRLIVCYRLFQCASVQVEMDIGRKNHDGAPFL